MFKKKKKHSHLLQGLIWKVIPNLEFSTILIELRVEETQKVHYYVIDVLSPKKIRSLTFTNQWWSGVDTFYKNLIIYHTFEGNRNPIRKELTALDIQKEKTAWSAEGFIYQYFDGISFIANTHQQLEPYKINPETGKIESELSKEALPLPQESKKVLLPSHYKPDDDNFEMINEFLKGEFDLPDSLAIDYMETENNIFFSSSYQVGERMAQELIVIDHDGGLQLREILNESTTGISNESFMIMDKKLIFIKNKCELVIFAL